MKLDIRLFAEHDAPEVFSMLESTEELHVGGLTYSRKRFRTGTLSELKT